MPRIITRAEWGFDGWRDPKNPPSRITEANRTAFFTHYQGGPTRYRTGNSVPRSIHAMHKANGWKGIGYGHIVDNDGTIYEGRGFNLSGSHCPGWNTAGYSAQGHIGVGERPSAAMLASLRWLYDEACRRSGRSLSKRGHRDGVATSCPGDVLYAWVKAGMPSAGGSGGMTAPINTTPDTPGRALVPYPGHVHHLTGPDDHHVEQIQKRITQLGYPLTADSAFGPKTDAGVRWFQELKGLTVDGRVGPKTWAALKIYNRA